MKKLCILLAVLLILAYPATAGELKPDLVKKLSETRAIDEVPVIIIFNDKPMQAQVDDIKAEGASSSPGNSGNSGSESSSSQGSGGDSGSLHGNSGGNSDAARGNSAAQTITGNAVLRFFNYNVNQLKNFINQLTNKNQ